MYEKPLALFLVSFEVLYCAVILNRLSCRLVLRCFQSGSVVFPASSLVRDKMCFAIRGPAPRVLVLSSLVGCPPCGGLR